MTLRQIAEEVGVSISTVSRVVNQSNTKAASPEVQKRIWEVVNKYGYRITSPIKGRSRSNTMLACIFARESRSVADNPYFTGISESFEEKALEKGYITQNFFTTYDLKNKDISILLGNGIDNILLIGRHKADLIEFLKQHVSNIVYAGLMPPATVGYDSVTCNAYRIGVEATSYLINKGHRSIAYIGDASEENRFLGYKDTLKANGIEYDPEKVVSVKESMENGLNSMSELLKKRVSFTAVFCMNDLLALGAMRAIMDYGLRVPDDIAIIGVDDIEAASYANPKLTTIHTPMKELGAIAAKTLISRIEGDHTINLSIELPFYVIERGSC